MLSLGRDLRYSICCPCPYPPKPITTGGSRYMHAPCKVVPSPPLRRVKSRSSIMFLRPSPTSRIPLDFHTPLRRPWFHQRCPPVLRYDMAHRGSSSMRPTCPGSHDSPAKAFCVFPNHRPGSCFHNLLSRRYLVRTGTKTSPRDVGRCGFRGRDPAGGEHSFAGSYGPGFSISLLLHSGSRSGDRSGDGKEIAGQG